MQFIFALQIVIVSTLTAAPPVSLPSTQTRLCFTLKLENERRNAEHRLGTQQCEVQEKMWIY